MIIRKIHIENFGHFHDFTLELAPGLNRLRHENEFGKSTIFEFVRRVLWGFPDGRKSQLNHYPARFNAGEYGGYLEVELADGSSAVLERYGVRGELVVRRPDGSTEPGEEFLRRLTPVSGDCYRKVYAITLDELTELSTLDGDEIRGRLYGGAITGGDVSLPALGKHLDAKAKELYKQRGAASRIATARQEFREICERRDRAVNDSFRRVELEKERAELEGATAKLRAEVSARAQAVADTELLLKAHPRFLELGALDRELAAQPPAPEVPESAAARAEELAKRLEDMKRDLPPAPDGTRLAMLAAEAALVDRELAECSDGEIPLPDEAALTQAQELARRAAPAAQFPLRCLADYRVASILALTLLVLPEVFMFVPIPDLPYRIEAALAVAAFGIVLAVLLTRRAAKRRHAAELEKIQAEARERWRLVCPPEEFVPTLEKRLRREALANELRKQREATEAHARVSATERELTELCRRFNCADSAQMRECARRSAEVAARRRKRAETAAALDALLPRERLPELEKLDPGAARQKCAEDAQARTEADRELFLLHRRAGALANELKHLPQGGEIELLESEVERARGEIRRLVREYLVLRTARGLLDAAVARYERESQPEVLKRAEALFCDFTGGRYTHLYKSVASGELTACDKLTGLEKTFGALSRGTREELMLAMRLALVECTEREAEPLPVCFDDVGVNFDPARLGRVESAVEKFAKKRQVIWFSHS
jgi:uncharacterized protein YhaN